MPGHAFLTDDEVSQLVTFLRQNFGNHATPIRPAEVADIRANP
jgi:mono/diheme cytochrome c family protein